MSVLRYFNFSRQFLYKISPNVLHKSQDIFNKSYTTHQTHWRQRQFSAYRHDDIDNFLSLLKSYSRKEFYDNTNVNMDYIER